MEPDDNIAAYLLDLIVVESVSYYRRSHLTEYRQFNKFSANLVVLT